MQSVTAEPKGREMPVSGLSGTPQPTPIKRLPWMRRLHVYSSHSSARCKTWLREPL